MEPVGPLAPVEARRPTPVRVVLASAVVLALRFVSLGYHDGLFWTDDLSSATQPGPYRFKGVISHYDPVAQTLLLRDGDVEETLSWNVTEPAVGRVYVVDAESSPVRLRSSRAAASWRSRPTR